MQPYVKERDLILKKPIKKDTLYGSDHCNVLEGGQLIG